MENDRKIAEAVERERAYILGRIARLTWHPAEFGASTVLNDVKALLRSRRGKPVAKAK